MLIFFECIKTTFSQRRVYTRHLAILYEYSLVVDVHLASVIIRYLQISLMDTRWLEFDQLTKYRVRMAVFVFEVIKSSISNRIEGEKGS